MVNDDPVATHIQALVHAGELAGAATLVWRRGEIVQASATGWRDIAAGAPMTRGTLFRIASMSKPITSMAALMLMERGRFALHDPITRWAPEFGQMRVLLSTDGPINQADLAGRDITFHDLLTHRSGLTYGAFHTGPIAQAYADALGGDIDTDVPPDQWIAGLADLPLIDQPGAAFQYGHSTDLLGLLLARMEDATLGDVLRQLIFGPLGMRDTHFTVPAAKRNRRAGHYGFNANGHLSALLATPGGATVAERPASMAYESGGQGLWSTVDDYLAFARVFVGRGAVDGVRLLRPETLALMTSNHLTDRQRIHATILGMPIFGEGHGFGLGVAVVLDPAEASVMRGRGGIGTVGWPGAYGGWWQADPTNASVMILLAHNMVDLELLDNGIGLGVYDAIEQLHAAASAGPALSG